MHAHDIALIDTMKHIVCNIYILERVPEQAFLVLPSLYLCCCNMDKFVLLDYGQISSYVGLSVVSCLLTKGSARNLHFSALFCFVLFFFFTRVTFV